jgi:hypothetical protein
VRASDCQGIDTLLIMCQTPAGSSKHGRSRGESIVVARPDRRSASRSGQLSNAVNLRIVLRLLWMLDEYPGSIEPVITIV